MSTLRRIFLATCIACLVVGLALPLVGIVYAIGTSLPNGGWIALVQPFLALLVGLALVALVVHRVAGLRTGVVDGVRYLVAHRKVEVDLRPAKAAILGRRELEEIAAGEASRRTGSFAAKPEFREAVSVLLASGEETVLFLEPEGIRFEGYRRGPVEDVVRALVRLAGPGFVLSHHAGTGVCPYCKGAIASEPSSCEACGAEHHAGCLAEHGGCAIFGCERAPSARRAREKA